MGGLGERPAPPREQEPPTPVRAALKNLAPQRASVREWRGGTLSCYAAYVKARPPWANWRSMWASHSPRHRIAWRKLRAEGLVATRRHAQTNLLSLG